MQPSRPRGVGVRIAQEGAVFDVGGFDHALPPRPERHRSDRLAA
jgi:hypothetical protein